MGFILNEFELGNVCSLNIGLHVRSVTNIEFIWIGDVIRRDYIVTFMRVNYGVQDVF